MKTKPRLVLFVLAGVALLLLEGRYSGPYEDLVHSYGGNVAASFAVYFIAAIGFARLPVRPRFARAMIAGSALAVVELFEVLDGFGVMTNVYDRIDLAANAAGIVLALAVDVVTGGLRGAGHPSNTATLSR